MREREREEEDQKLRGAKLDPIAPAAVDFPRVEGRSGFDFLYGCTLVFNLYYIVRRSNT